MSRRADRFAPIVALEWRGRAARIVGVPYRAIPHDERRRRLAESVYHDAPAERPDWLHEELLRPGQVAALFQVSRRTIGDWARAGMLDAIITPGGHRRFRARHVRALLASLHHEVPVAKPKGLPD